MRLKDPSSLAHWSAVACSLSPHADVHLRLSIVKNIGEMSVISSFGSVPQVTTVTHRCTCYTPLLLHAVAVTVACRARQRLLPPYTEMGLTDSLMTKTICRAGRFYAEDGPLSRYYFGIYGGRVCAAYEITVESFRGPCSSDSADEVASASSEADVASQAVTSTSVSQWECVRGSSYCPLALDHSSRSSCLKHERTPPFVIAFDYVPGTLYDNIVFEVTDLNLADNPESLEVSLFSGNGSHGVLDLQTPLA